MLQKINIGGSNKLVIACSHGISFMLPTFTNKSFESDFVTRQKNIIVVSFVCIHLNLQRSYIFLM